MEVLHVKKYNKKQTAKWEKRWDECKNDPDRFPYNMPQLIFYIFQKNYGYVAFDDKKSLWAKTKKEVIGWWEGEERLRKIKGY